MEQRVLTQSLDRNVANPGLDRTPAMLGPLEYRHVDQKADTSTLAEEGALITILSPAAKQGPTM